MANDMDNARQTVAKAIDYEADALRKLSLEIHSHPEIAYEEHFAHDTLCDFLETRGFNVRRHAYGLETSFEAEIGSGGRLVVFCAEYDALPGIGHGCGHNLIAASSMASFIGLAKALQGSEIAGTVRILGTPAEEGGGGKAKLIEAGAFKDGVAAAIMSHPISYHGLEDGVHGLAGLRTNASHKLRVEYHGRGAHAAGDPWEGINALDAAVAAYNGISMLRQQIEPDERIHGIIEVGGEAPNVIPHYTRMGWNVRSSNVARADTLLARAKACFEAGAAATGCKINYIPALTYKDLRMNEPLCAAYVQEMSRLDRNVMLKEEKPRTMSTDMGNVSYEVPSFHGVFGIPTKPGIPGHHPEFAKAAAAEEAHEETMKCAKAMGMLGWRILVDESFADEAKRQAGLDI